MSFFGVDARELRLADPGESRLKRLWWPLLGAGLGVVTAWWLVRPPAGIAGVVVYEGTGYSAAALIAVGTLVRRPRRAWPWLLLAACIALSATGDLVWDLTEILGNTPGYTSWLASSFYLGSYPALFAALFGLLGPRARRRDRGLLLDALALACALWLAIWIVAVGPALPLSGINFSDWMPTLAYPPLDVFALVLVWRLGRGLRRTVPWVLLGTSIGITLSADVGYAVLGMPADGLADRILSAGYLLGYGLIALAALHPDMRLVEGPAEPVLKRPARARGVVALCAALSIPPLLLVVWPDEVGLAPGVVGSVGLALIAIAALRAMVAGASNRESEATLAWHATHDQLTGLANRAAFLDELALAQRNSRLRHRSCAVLFCDLDDFKVINDALGHDVGDAVLVGVAERLRLLVRAEDSVARLGGDEFVIACPALDDLDDAVTLAHRIVDACHEPFLIGETAHHVSVSIGVVMMEAGDALEPESMLRDADLAMYAAKTGGRDRVELFDADFRHNVETRLDTQTALREGLVNREFRLAYQPLVALSDQRIIGREALIRWQRPGHGLIPPDDFVAIAESTGQIVELGAWVLRSAAAYLRELQDRDEPGGVWVNVSSHQLNQPGFAQHAAEILATERVDPSDITLELTEAALVLPTATVRENMTALRAAGFRIAIDDFGTGYSSLAYLKTLEVDALKIDRIFIRDLTLDAADQTLVRAIIAMAHSLGVMVIAEGIEEPHQLAALRALGCDGAQGFLIARPTIPRQPATETRGSGPSAPQPSAAGRDGA
jgi:diguanylate cyclase